MEFITVNEDQLGWTTYPVSRRRLTSLSISFQFRAILGSERPTATTSPLESLGPAVVVDNSNLPMNSDVNPALDPDMVGLYPRIELVVADEVVVRVQKFQTQIRISNQG